MFSNVLDKVRRDPKALAFSKARKFKLALIRFFSTIYTRTWLKLEGIEVAGNSAFYGIPICCRAPGSRIVIAENCSFRSHIKSNLIGINRPCILSTFSDNAVIQIGSHSGFSGTSIGASTSIIIGKGVLCGANTLITDFDWHPVNPEIRHEPNASKSAPVVLHDNVWLGYGSIVLKGVTIGRNSVITPNSVVVSDIPENVIAGGNPAKVIKEIQL